MTCSKIYVLFYLYFSLQLTHFTAAQGPGGPPVFDRCFVMATFDLQQCIDTGNVYFPHSQCVENRICNKTINTTVIRLEPHSSRIFPHMLSQMVNACCGNCTKTREVNFLTDSKDITVEKINMSDIAYPVLASSSVKHLFGFHFIPIISVGDCFFISAKTSPEEILDHLVESCGNLWPLLVICLLMALIAGFPVWLIETWNNAAEFPMSFLKGLWEGFWWSFVTMTTVGYGDKSPRFILARLISIIWIILGITICSLFTAALTTEISKATADPTPTMSGLRVGVIKGRMYEASIVTKKGGYVDVTKYGTLKEGVIEMVEKMKNNTIDGFLMDEHSYMFTTAMFRNMEKAHEKTGGSTNAEFYLNKTIQTTVPQSGTLYSYGFLVKGLRNYNFFTQFIEDNQHNMEVCKALQVSKKPDRTFSSSVQTNNIFSTGAGMFMAVLTILLIILGVMLFLGLLYEIGRKTVCKKHFKRFRNYCQRLGEGRTIGEDDKDRDGKVVENCESIEMTNNC